MILPMSGFGPATALGSLAVAFISAGVFYRFAARIKEGAALNRSTSFGRNYGSREPRNGIM